MVLCLICTWTSGNCCAQGCTVLFYQGDLGEIHFGFLLSAFLWHRKCTCSYRSFPDLHLILNQISVAVKKPFKPLYKVYQVLTDNGLRSASASYRTLLFHVEDSFSVWVQWYHFCLYLLSVSCWSLASHTPEQNRAHNQSRYLTTPSCSASCHSCCWATTGCLPWVTVATVTGHLCPGAPWGVGLGGWSSQRFPARWGQLGIAVFTFLSYGSKRVSDGLIVACLHPA